MVWIEEVMACTSLYYKLLPLERMQHGVGHHPVNDGHETFPVRSPMGLDGNPDCSHHHTLHGQVEPWLYFWIHAGYNPIMGVLVMI